MALRMLCQSFVCFKEIKDEGRFATWLETTSRGAAWPVEQRVYLGWAGRSGAQHQDSWVFSPAGLVPLCNHGLLLAMPPPPPGFNGAERSSFGAMHWCSRPLCLDPSLST